MPTPTAPLPTIPVPSTRLAALRLVEEAARQALDELTAAGVMLPAVGALARLADALAIADAEELDRGRAAEVAP